MIRTLAPEAMRHGRPGIADDYSHLGESLFDHPYQWGSKRTGPDLAREGGEIPKSLIDAKVYLPSKPDLKDDARRNYLAKSEVIALIAYLQKLGSYKEVEKDQPLGPTLLDPDSHRRTDASN